MSMILSLPSWRRLLGAFALLLVGLGGAWGSVDNVAYLGGFPASTPAGLTQASLVINGAGRDLLIYRPAGASPALLILFSGTGSSLASNIADDLGRDNLRAFADRENVVVAVPMQRVMSIGDWDNHSAGTPYWETATGESTASPASTNPDTNPDLLFTRAIIKEASSAYGADLSRVYVNGFSNGAFFSYFVAATLSNRIAAFAETGGGMVLSGTTAGEPAPCAPRGTPAAYGEVRGCAAAGWTPGMCSTPGAMTRPVAPTAVVRVPPGFLEANDEDDVVGFAHTCNLAQALPASPAYQVRIVHIGNGHGINGDYFENSWNFMKNYRLTDSDRVFNWAEATYPALLSPASPVSGTIYGYYYRYYSNTGNYIGTKDGRGYHLLQGGEITDAGALADFLGVADAGGF